jgi:hypothetical protein
MTRESTGPEDRDAVGPGAEDAPVDELAADAEERNPDTTTRREALELDLEEQGRSDEGEEVGDAIN